MHQAFSSVLPSPPAPDANRHSLPPRSFPTPKQNSCETPRVSHPGCCGPGRWSLCLDRPVLISTQLQLGALEFGHFAVPNRRLLGIKPKAFQKLAGGFAPATPPGRTLEGIAPREGCHCLIDTR